MVLGKIYRLSYRQDQQSFSLLLEHRNDKTESLLFESGVITALSQTETEQLKPMYKLMADVYACLGCLSIAINESITVNYLIFISGCISIGKIHQTEIFKITDTLFISLRNHQSDVERVQELRKILASGAFYFSWSASAMPMDLTLALQRQIRTQETDNRFFWNKLMYPNFIRYGINTTRWLVKTVCGSIVISTVYVGQHQVRACIFSRLSNERVGTRYNVRGVNDDGQVANFVETEQCIFMDDSDTKFSSYLILRGSVPLFWEQPGVNVGSHKIKLSRGSELTQPAYDKHLIALKQAYGKSSYINLLGSKEGEAMLAKMYREHHQASQFSKDVPFVAFDYHAQCPKGRQDNLRKKLLYDINKQLGEFGMLVGKNFARIQEFDQYPELIDCFQNGCFRINCVDCLDRTNSVQTFIGLWILQKQIAALKLDDKPQIISRLEDVFRNMWIQNGDQISRIYAGTGALEGKSKLKDGTLSVARTIQNNLWDFSKQEAFDLLVQPKSLNVFALEKARALLPRHFLHLPGNILTAVCDRYLDFTETQTLTIAVGTWNVNGGKNLGNAQYKKSDPLADWLVTYATGQKKKSPSIPNLLDLSLEETMTRLEKGDCQLPDIYAIGLEEIVDLNASNIVSASTTNQREFLIDFQQTISRRCPYVLVTSTQLVGVCLYIFVRPMMANRIRDVQVDQVKTGLGGAAGNKGAVAIRMQLSASRLCFVCSHFAAGQNHVEERNSDFNEINRKINFSQGGPLNAHDYIFWCGDFNYRIDLPNDEVRELVNNGDLHRLLENDQLIKEHREGKIFPGYLEGEITFPPTYKYDSFSNEYDTSEKSRIPAWTDRILYKKLTATRKHERSDLGEGLDYGTIVHYGRAELKTSDHRPVIAEFVCDYLKVVESKREEIIENVFCQTGPTDCSLAILHDDGKDAFHPDLIGKILLALNDFGEIILTRFCSDSLTIIFKESKSALKASKASLIDIDSRLKVQLKTLDWRNEIEKEISLVKNNTISICDGQEISTDSDFFSTSIGPSCDPNSFCMDDDPEVDAFGRISPDDEDDASGSDRAPPVLPSRGTPTKPPLRPPPPSSSRPSSASTTTNAISSPTSGLFSSPESHSPINSSTSPVRPPKPIPQRPAPPPPLMKNPLEENSSPFGMPPPSQSPPPIPSNRDLDIDFGPPPIPPPRFDSLEEGINLVNPNAYEEEEEELVLSPWQTLPPAPPTPPMDYRPPPVPNRPSMPIASHSGLIDDSNIPNAPPPNIPPPPLPVTSSLPPPNIPPRRGVTDAYANGNIIINSNNNSSNPLRSSHLPSNPFRN